MLEQEYLALASGSEEAFRETLKRERQVVGKPGVCKGVV